MAFTKAQLEALKNTILASAQPITAAQHRSMVQNLIDEMFDPQSRGNLLAGVQADGTIISGDAALVIRSGQAYLVPLDVLIAANSARIRTEIFDYSGTNVFQLNETPLDIIYVGLNGPPTAADGLAWTIDGDEITVNYDLQADDYIQICYSNKPLSLVGIGSAEAISIFDQRLLVQKDQEGGIAANDTAILNLDTVVDLSTINRVNRTRAYVNGGGQGGSTFTYIPTGSGLVADDGVYFDAADGGLWGRDFNGMVYPEWFGAVGNGVVDDSIPLQAALNSGFDVFLETGKIFAYTDKIVVSNRTNFSILGNGSFKDLGKVIGTTVGTAISSVSFLFENCENIMLDGPTFISSNTTEDRVLEAEIPDRLPLLDFQGCKNIKLSFNLSGLAGPYVSITEVLTDFDLMRSSMLRVYDCNILTIDRCRVLNNSGAGEPFSINQCVNVYISNSGFVEETGTRIYSLFKVIDCDNVLIGPLYTKKLSNSASFIDVSGKNITLENINLDNPTGRFLDITKEWVEDTQSENITVRDCSGNGEGIHCSVYGTKIEIIKSLLVDNFSLSNPTNDPTLVTATEMDYVSVKNINLHNLTRVLFYDIVTTAALQSSQVDGFKITADSSRTLDRFLVYLGKGEQTWRNGTFDFGYNKELRLDNFNGGTGKDLSLIPEKVLNFENVTFRNLILVVSSNINFTNCYFHNCAFQFNRAISSLNTNPIVNFYGGVLSYDLSYNRTDGRIFQTFGGLLKATFLGVKFEGLLHNTGGRGLLDNITAASNAYSGTWEFKDCVFDMYRWTGSANAEQQIFILSNSVNVANPISISFINCKVTDKMFIGSFRGATSSGSVNYLVVSIDKTTVDSSNINAFTQSDGTTSLDRVRLTVQNSIFGNVASTRVLNASGNTYNLLRYINNIDSATLSDI